jgi:hypothetical protein
MIPVIASFMHNTHIYWFTHGTLDTRFTAKTGLIRSKPLFTHDTQYLLRIYAYLISVFAAKTHFNTIYAFNLVYARYA